MEKLAKRAAAVRSTQPFLSQRSSYMPDIAKEEKYRDAAVNIRPVVQTDLRLHISDMAGDHVEDREIGSPRLWEIKVAGCRALERTDLRQQNSRRESTGKQGVDSKSHAALRVFFLPVPVLPK